MRDNVFQRQHGVLMIEVLVTILITTLGLLGIVALFSRSQQMGDEAYQRFQALDAAHQLGEALSVNRTEAALGNASAYVIAGTLAGDAAFTWTTSTIPGQDLGRFHQTLIGVQKKSGGTNIAPLIAARGCVSFLGTAGDPADPPRYQISVAWTGRQKSSAPADDAGCAAALYGDAEKLKLRRVVTIEVQVL